jgi:hypothetical protein
MMTRRTKLVTMALSARSDNLIKVSRQALVGARFRRMLLIVV